MSHSFHSLLMTYHTPSGVQLSRTHSPLAGISGERVPRADVVLVMHDDVDRMLDDINVT